MIERTPYAFDRVLRKLQVDRSLREQTGNTLNFATVIKHTNEGKPIYGGYTDELEATPEQKQEVSDLTDELCNFVIANGNTLSEESDLFFFYGEDDGIQRSTVKHIQTPLFDIVSGKRCAVPYLSFLTINSKTEVQNRKILGEFDDELYFLDIEFLPDNSRPYNYTISRPIGQLTRDDFEISMFLLQEADKELKSGN